MAKARIVEIRAETEQEKALDGWFAERALASPDTLDAAARTIVGLVTGLLGVLFGVMAVKEGNLPSYFWVDWMRPLAAASVLGLLVALGCALVVLYPREMRVPSARIDLQQAAFAGVLRRKSRWLRGSAIAFGVGMAALGAVLIVALMRVV